jgi:hypothetical protein
MTEPEEQPRPLAEPVREVNWKLRIVLALTVAVLLGLAFLFGTTVLPRWWAHRVGNRVDGSLTAGSFYGLFVGFVFTFVPLVIARQAFRRMRWKFRVAVLVLAVLVATPNLLTLSIVLGNGNAAHAGDRVLDVEGPGFRAGTAWGVVAAVVIGVGLVLWTWRWRRDRRQLAKLRAERKAVSESDRNGDAGS